MKKLLLTVTLLGLSACTPAHKSMDLTKELDKGSYAIGLQIGQNFKQQNIQINDQALSIGISDALSGKEQLPREEIQKALMTLQQSMMKKSQEISDKNKEDSHKFLVDNKSKDGVKTTASGLQYVIEKEGSGKGPNKDSMVRVNYTGKLIDGSTFDTSIKRNRPAEFKASQVIPGWSEALMMMKPGGKMKLFIPPELAYGPSARPGIPANSVLIFEVELISVN